MSGSTLPQNDRVDSIRGHLSNDVVHGPITWNRVTDSLRILFDLAVNGSDRDRMALERKTLDRPLHGLRHNLPCTMIRSGLASQGRQTETLDQAITNAINTITAENAAAWFRHCGYGIHRTLVSL